ncbi:MAG TPA: hypothetical protein VJK72_00215 [Candidatus Nanoarchaeia archaeon]|nr:hypothetical protein [Candidatus Nanoarchaeia archaeon]
MKRIFLKKFVRKKQKRFDWKNKRTTLTHTFAYNNQQQPKTFTTISDVITSYTKQQQPRKSFYRRQTRLKQK